ncbi:DUF3802 family protein [Shewanella sp. NKUCC05_KAH]|jgi:hypothetical protein|uniref:DUF3802 family protein n=1 Tax=Shewanella oncorhynchi TaxID=2726434 RepID=A0AA50KA72_9GAMM|nr:MULTISPECIES: DUF3802 family protein [Shewanella]RBP82701.1 uncharacterized protein DUF3802 [Shewanella putrefaciens]GCF88998.1 topoisomerase II [Shewanella sp. M-Br]MBP6520611.1 DUF3802 family protein [Shewanella sp.]MBW3525486.1 DUF3802 family protein [Shewanella sp. NKUCC05_KAH]MCU7997804.1 DUF3802 family protein [Shewanella sp. SM95]
MVTDKDGYMHLVQYLTEHLGLFETPSSEVVSDDTVMELFEEQLSAQIIMVCGQNPSLSFTQRNVIIREVDAIVYDLEEILASVANHKATPAQTLFITEFSSLIKNLFDQEIAKLQVSA